MKNIKNSPADRIISRITGWIAALTLLILTGWGIYTCQRLYYYEETNDAQVQEYVNPVISRAGGFIISVNFEENQVVSKGDTLLLIDPREYQLQEIQTAAELQKSIARLSVLESSIHTLQLTANAMQYQVVSGKAKLEKEQQDYDRYSKLYQAASATQRQLEDNKAALEVSKADYETAQQNYEASLARIQDTENEAAVIKAEIAHQQAILSRNRLDVSYTVIRAPYNGRMGRRSIEKGQMINAGDILAYIVNNETDKWVVANYKETQISKLHIGDSARVEADAYPGKTFNGTIISISPATGSSFSLLPPDNTTGNYVKIVQRIPVRIRLTGNRQDTELLKAGMNVNVYVPKKQHIHG
ncbi:MAG: HlyD family secretion protein [Chitinophagaceae bacterium]